jgi:hypothetical protein
VILSKLASDNEFVEQFADFWRALARHYASFDPDRVFFEILNKPEGRDAYRWSTRLSLPGRVFRMMMIWCFSSRRRYRRNGDWATGIECLMVRGAWTKCHSGFRWCGSTSPDQLST